MDKEQRKSVDHDHFVEDAPGGLATDVGPLLSCSFRERALGRSTKKGGR